MSKKLTFTPEHDQFAALLDEAQWSLTDTDIAKIVPGSQASPLLQLDNLINVPELFENPFHIEGQEAYSLERPDLALLKVLSDPQYFAFTCLHLFSLNGRDPLRLEAFQSVVLQEFWWRQLPLLACTRGFSKSFLLGLYIILRLTFQPGVQIAVVAKSLRQSMLIWEYCSKIWNNSPIFRDLIGGGTGSVENGPRRGGNDRCEFRINDSIALFLPLGQTGETIRGIRASIVISDEAACLHACTLVETNKGTLTIKECGDNLDGLTLRQPNGTFIAPSKFIVTAPIDAYRITTVGDYEFTCSAVHQVMTSKGWKTAKDLTAEDALVRAAWNVSVLSVELLPEKTVLYDFEVPGSHLFIGNGFIQHNSISEVVYAVVVQGFGAVSQDPVAKASRSRRERILKRLALWSDEMEANSFASKEGNQSILSGTASYQFNHFYRYWKDYRSVLMTKGDKAKLEEYFQGDIPPGFDWRRYSIMRIPWDRIPHGYMDEATISRALQISSTANFSLEYGACVRHGHKVTTDKGLCEIQNVKIGDLVLTHRGRFRPVTELHVRNYVGQIINYRTAGCDEVVGVTPDHPFWLGGEDWAKAERLSTHTNLARLSELSGLIRSDETELDCGAGEALGRYAATRALPEDAATHPFLSRAFREDSLDPEILYSNENFIRGFSVGYLQNNHYYPQFDKAKENISNQLRLCLSYFGIYIRCDLSLDDHALSQLNRLLDGGAPAVEEWAPAIEDKFSTPHSGPVYNLEVAEDHSYSLLNATVHNCFLTDSDGFFRRSTIDRASVGATDAPLPTFPSCGDVDFGVAMAGDPERRYVYGVDPAFQKDNFAIVIVEVWPDHRRIVYCWTTSKADHRARRKSDAAPQDFYSFCIRKLREMFTRFPPAEVLIDAGSGGGGATLVEAFSEPDKTLPGERCIYEVIDDKVPRDSDWKDGDHIIRLIQFSKHSWVVDSNWALRKDMESRVLLFPRIDEISFGRAYEEDLETGRIAVTDKTVETVSDTLESALHEIEELKNELTMIVVEATASGQERWDVPRGSLSGTKGVGLKKDRYSALLMANWGARTLQSGSISIVQSAAGVGGGYAGLMGGSAASGGRMYIGNARMMSALNNSDGHAGYGYVKKK